MAETLEYPYKVKPLMMFGGIVFFGVAAVFMGHTAAANDRGLILNGILTLSVGGATVFYWCVAAVSALFVVVAVAALIAGAVNPAVVRLTATEISAPKYGFSTRPTVIPLREITGIQIQTVQKQRFIHVYSGVARLSIAQSMLPSNQAFEKLQGELIAAVSSQTGGQLAASPETSNVAAPVGGEGGGGLLDWSAGAIKATVGLGGLGIAMLLISSLDRVLHMEFWHAFVVSFAPAFIFFFATPDMLPAKAIRVAQWVAVVWYFVLAALSLAAAAYRGLIAIDLMFVGMMLLGAWPCLLAAHKLRSTSET